MKLFKRKKYLYHVNYHFSNEEEVGEADIYLNRNSKVDTFHDVETMKTFIKVERHRLDSTIVIRNWNYLGRGYEDV